MKVSLIKTKLILGAIAITILLAFSLCSYEDEKRKDLKTYLPPEAIAYLEIRSLKKIAAILEKGTIYDQHSLPDFSLAIAILDFEFEAEGSENNQKVISIKPNFVVVIETEYEKAVNAQFLETILNNLLDKFSMELKKKEPENNGLTEWIDKKGEPRLFSFSSNDIVYLSNNEASLRKAISIEKGSKLDLPKPEPVEQEELLASGYAKSEFVSQMADLIGVYLAFYLSEREFEQKLIAQAISSVLKSSFHEIQWKMKRKDNLIQDSIFLKTDSSTSKLLKEHFSSVRKTNFQEFISEEAESLRIYSFQNPKLAWHSLVNLVSEKTNPQFASSLNLLFLPYGISDPEGFLDSIDSEILVVKFDSEETAIIAKAKNLERLLQSLSFKPINTSQHTKTSKIWYSKDQSMALALQNNRTVILGDAHAVKKSIDSNWKLPKLPDAIISSLTKDSETEGKLRSIFGNPENSKTSLYVSEIHFADHGFQYEATSDFGLIGYLIANHLL